MKSEALAEIAEHWRHCLRCKLADKRLENDPGRGKAASEVPGFAGDIEQDRSTLHILYPCPDPEQYEFGNVNGSFSTEVLSRSHFLLQMTWAMLAEHLPFDWEELTFSFALGCRPVNFEDPRKIMAPKQEWLKACAPRWQAEVKVADPDLVLLCGRHALATVRRDLATKFNDYVGEVVPFVVYGKHPPLHYVGYVAPSPEDIVTNTHKAHYTLDGWNFGPQANHVRQPFHYWCWHVLFAAWLARTLRQLRSKDPITPDTSLWGDLVDKFGEFYDTQHSIRAVLERIKLEVSVETSGPGARAVQTDSSVFTALRSQDTEEEVLDGDEEEDDGRDEEDLGGDEEARS